MLSACYQRRTRKAFLIESNMAIEKQGVKLEPVEELNELKLANGKVIKVRGEIPQ